MSKKFCFPLLLIGGLLFIAQAARCQTVSLTLNAGQYRIVPGAQGDTVEMDGFSPASMPGNPQLPAKIYDVALPPSTDMATVQLAITNVVTEEVPGTYNLRPAPAAASAPSGRSVRLNWGSASNIRGGKNLDVYNLDQKYPKSVAVLEELSGMRKWKFARVQFFPVQYNPVSGKVYVVKSAVVTVSGSVSSRSRLGAALLGDNAMDSVAAERFVNYDAARAWYKEGAATSRAVTYNYAIITTNAIKANSEKLPLFVSQLKARGYKPLIVTESDYGSLTGQSPDGTAEKIRKWLIDNYSTMGIVNVLLIGDPTPVTGDVPMKMCWPRKGCTDGDCKSPTDYFYSNLTGNWDLNGDGYFGDYAGDRGVGGVSFTPEVYVGRIPVYGSDYSTLDAVLQKIIDYKNITGAPAWRKKMFLPMAISNYYNEDSNGSARSDGLDLPKYVVNDYLTAANHSYYAAYEKAGLLPVPDTASYDNGDHEGVSSTMMIREINKGYGTVLWWGHGSETGVSRKYWKEDTNNDGIPQAGEMLWPDMFNSTHALSLTDAYPSFFYQCSCNNGYPEDTANLGYALLKKGAVNTVSASRVSWYAVGYWTPMPAYSDNASMGYSYMNLLISSGMPAGQALASVKSSMGDSFGNSSWMNKMDFNVYGDPTTTLFYNGSEKAPRLAWANASGYTDDGVNVATGAASNYDFRVDYTDEDDDPPADGYPKLHLMKNGAEVSGSPFAMAEEDSDGSYANGSRWHISVTTCTIVVDDISDYTYSFEAYDAQGAAAMGDPLSLRAVRQGVSPLADVSAARAYPVPWKPGANNRQGSATVAGCGTGLIFDRLSDDGKIYIYNTVGDLVKTLEFHSSNNACVSWDGKNGSGRDVASGVYLAVVKGGGQPKTLKLAIVR